MNARASLAVALAIIFPGAGHFYLRRRTLAVAFSAIIVALFVVGLWIGGDLYSLKKSQGDILETMASIGSMGSGALYFTALKYGPYGDIRNSSFEYGTTFTLTAGLMNLLLVVDCFDRATGRKKA